VNDLHTLLINAQITGPYVLVGHSLGGWFVCLYAGQYPEKVVGMVLLDSLHPDAGLRISAALPKETQNESAYLTSQRNTWAGYYGSMDVPEGIDFLKSAEQVRTVTSLGDMPLLLLTGNPFTGNDTEIDQLEYNVWLAMQRELATLSTNGSQVVIQEAGHFLWADKPDEVVNAINQFVQDVRATQP
jgi:pimeloyl-ACP methyl ester carboxylesterase